MSILLTPSLNRNLTVASATATYAIRTVDDVVMFSSSSFTATLPTAVGVAGKTYQLMHSGTSLTQVYTLATTSSQTIGGVASGSYAFYTNGECLIIVSDGANWQILSHKAVTEGVQYTPTYTGFGTPSASAMYWARNGTDLLIRGRFTGGTATGVEARMSFPNNITSVSTITTLECFGMLAKASVGANIAYGLGEPSTAYMTFGSQTSGEAGLATKQTGSYWGNNQTFSVAQYRIPITGWQP